MEGKLWSRICIPPSKPSKKVTKPIAKQSSISISNKAFPIQVHNIQSSIKSVSKPEVGVEFEKTYADKVIYNINDAENAINEMMTDIESGVCAFDCEGVNLSATGELTVLQIAYKSLSMGKIVCIIFDILSTRFCARYASFC